MRRQRVTALLALTLTALAGIALTGCSAAPGATPEPAATPTDRSPVEDHVQGTLTIAAAASLQPAFEELTTEFTKLHPDVTVDQLTFDGSSVLAAQIIAGAPIDVFASADEANMQKVAEAQLLASDPIPFARSSLEIAVAPGNPLGITTLADLGAPTQLAGAGAAGDAPVVVICAAEVPCGAASHRLLDRDGVALTPASEEQNVTAVLTKVAAGEADAGLIYRSDVLRSGGDVEGIEIAGSADAAGLYVIAPIAESAAPEAALAFAEFMRSPEVQARFEDLGFGQA
ncbi:molybdate transport system substrate-binding protein [Leucobacter luti]|uniref:Molybdate transport system substrate-binding protein n=1 Tax=Leucobacter luti TaxID=340320 RepID=A0A4R6S490_9MICO|nr:molybdate ABC transporter substrate-binding protein [Leucobacter luti]TDP94451.1 molybdate transport system substrate-binding protein [Leucobacter luti]